VVFVRRKKEPRWLWHAIDHRRGQVLAYVFGRRQDEVFLKFNWLQVLGIAELTQINQCVRYQLHAIMSLLDVFKTQQ
jgi:IS1 family transposase